MRVYVDASPLQDRITGERGIGRYVSELARAMERQRPTAVDRWMLRPEGPVPTQVPELVWGAKAAFGDDPDLPRPDIWHVTSPFESLDQPLETVWPRWSRHPRTRLFVTLYDLIPLVYDDVYLPERQWRARYDLRAQLVARADKVLAISEASARDAVRLLGVQPSRIEVVGTGTPPEFVAKTPEELQALPAPDLPGLRPDYVMYTGGIDFRKNIDGLLRAWALLPAGLRRAHQLLVVCRASEHERATLTERARELGIERDVLVPGYVPDETLRSLYAHTALFVFPSLYEGFGLPVVEAASCGAPVIAGDNSSLIELVPDPRGRFQADDPADIARCVAAVLTDEELRNSLRQPDIHLSYRWSDVAHRVADAYDAVPVPVRRGPRRTRVWLVSPMPPTPSGVADYSAELLRELALRADVDVLTTKDAERMDIPGVRWFTYAAADALDAQYGAPDLRLLAMGNSEFHVPVMRILRKFGGTVIAHDIRYTGLLAAVRVLAPELLDNGAAEALDDIAAERLPASFRDHGWLQPHDYYMTNNLLSGEALRGSGAVLTHSRSAAGLARLNLGPGMRSRVEVVPFGHRVRHAAVDRDAVVSLGIQHWTKATADVCRTFVQLAPDFPELTFALVGQFFDEELLAECRAMIDESGLRDRVLLTGRVSDEQYDQWLGRARLAVQLRVYTNGESSAAVADCLGAGVPLVTSALGASTELDGVAQLVPAVVSADELTSTVGKLLDDGDELDRLAALGRRYARHNSFGHVAEALLARAGHKFAQVHSK